MRNPIVTIARMMRDTRASVLVEFAFVFPLFALILVGTTDFAMGFAQKLKTQQAAARTIEMVTIGSGDLTTAATSLRAEAAFAAGVRSEDVTVDVWLECNGTRQLSVDGYCATGQETARFASVKIQNRYTPAFGALLPSINSSDGAYHFIGKSSVRLQ